jgi:hypothetical protein
MVIAVRGAGFLCCCAQAFLKKRASQAGSAKAVHRSGSAFVRPTSHTFHAEHHIVATDVSSLSAFIAALATALTIIGCVIHAVTKARECRQLRLENDKLELEITLLRTEAAKKGIAISVPTAQELDAALRDRAAFTSLKTLGKASELTRASEPDPAYEQYCLEVRRKVRRFMIRLAMGGAVACSLIAIALWW